MTTRHPDQDALRRWLATGGPAKVDRHVGECDECQEALERLSALDETTRTDLASATTPPEGLRSRTQHGVDDRLRDEAAFGAFLDLFTIGWSFTRAVLDSATHGEPPHSAAASADETDGGTR